MTVCGSRSVCYPPRATALFIRIFPLTQEADFCRLVGTGPPLCVTRLPVLAGWAQGWRKWLEGRDAPCVRGQRFPRRSGPGLGGLPNRSLQTTPSGCCWLLPPGRKSIQATWVAAYVLDLIVLEVATFWGGIS